MLQLRAFSPTGHWGQNEPEVPLTKQYLRPTKYSLQLQIDELGLAALQPLQHSFISHFKFRIKFCRNSARPGPAVR